MTQKAYNKIIALKVVQSGRQDGINLLTTQIYNNVLEKAKVYEGTVRQELLEKIKRECSGLTNTIVPLWKKYNELDEDFRKDLILTGEFNEALSVWATLSRDLKKRVKVLQ